MASEVDSSEVIADVLTLAERKQILSSLAADDKVHPRDRINAIDILNKVDHIYTTFTDGNVTIRVVYDGSPPLPDGTADLLQGELAALETGRDDEQTKPDLD
jgi:hypothetical protein